MPRISKFFGLGKSQGELDFVDVEVSGDNLLFVDPFAISQLKNPLSEKCHSAVTVFFDRLVKVIRRNRNTVALELLDHLHEPNETRLGYSQEEPRGGGIGDGQSRDILIALTSSAAMRTGFITHLPECVLLIPGIARDKISDLTTNVIRAYLVEYTARQCELHGIPLEANPILSVFNTYNSRWESRPHDLPVAGEMPLLFVPRAFVREAPAYDPGKYYQHHVLNHLQAENLSRHTSLVKTLKDGRRKVYKKALQAKHPCTKQYLYEFSRKNPEVLQNYRTTCEETEKAGPTGDVSSEEEKLTIETLEQRLREIKAGPESASQYHSLMAGLLVFLFHPDLLNPKKEYEVHSGHERRRIDILLENAAHRGIFSILHKMCSVACRFVAFECQNYGPDSANPSISHLIDRFSEGRVKVGFLCCRGFKNKDLLLQHCREAFVRGKGLVVPLDDDFFIEALAAVEGASRDNINNILTMATGSVARP